MSIDEQQHSALPSLYGAPAYARPPGPAPTKDRPFDPDELPLEAHQTDEEREFSSTLPARAYAPGGADLEAGRGNGTAGSGGSRTFRVRTITKRFRKG